MATTSIGSDRNDAALQRYNDAVFVRDDKKFYLGDGGDFSIEYDEDGNDVALAAGADLRLSDTQQLQLGDAGDFTIAWDGSKTVLTGGDLFITNQQALVFSDVNIEHSDNYLKIQGLPDSDPSTSDALWVSDTVLKLSAG